MPTATENIKHSPTPSQININPHTMPITPVPTTWNNRSSQDMPKGKKKHLEEKMQSWELDSDMTQMVE